MRRGWRQQAVTAGACLAVLVAAERPAAAADKGVFGLRGAGTLSCRQFSEAYKAEDERTMYLAGGWIDGFVTALNQEVDGVFEFLPWQSTVLVLDLVNSHCLSQPDEPFSTAVARLLQVSAPTRLASKSDITRIPVPQGGTIELHKASLAQAQERLKALGHYTSTIDGAYGPGTAAAFKAFQVSAGLPDTGLPDQVTLWTLFAPLYQERAAN